MVQLMVKWWLMIVDEYSGRTRDGLEEAWDSHGSSTHEKGGNQRPFLMKWVVVYPYVSIIIRVWDQPIGMELQRCFALIYPSGGNINDHVQIEHYKLPVPLRDSPACWQSWSHIQCGFLFWKLFHSAMLLEIVPITVDSIWREVAIWLSTHVHAHGITQTQYSFLSTFPDSVHLYSCAFSCVTRSTQYWNISLSIYTWFPYTKVPPSSICFLSWLTSHLYVP